MPTQTYCNRIAEQSPRKPSLNFQMRHKPFDNCTIMSNDNGTRNAIKMPQRGLRQRERQWKKNVNCDP